MGLATREGSVGELRGGGGGPFQAPPLFLSIKIGELQGGGPCQAPPLSLSIMMTDDENGMKIYRRIQINGKH